MFVLSVNQYWFQNKKNNCFMRQLVEIMVNSVFKSCAVIQYVQHNWVSEWKTPLDLCCVICVICAEAYCFDMSNMQMRCLCYQTEGQCNVTALSKLKLFRSPLPCNFYFLYHSEAVKHFVVFSACSLFMGNFHWNFKLIMNTKVYFASLWECSES